MDEIFVGIDWATQKHDVCVVDGSGTVLAERQFDHSGEGLVRLTQWLVEQADQKVERLRVAIEVNQGPVVETLMDRGIVVFSINPKQLDRFRDRFTLAGAKDDRLDARVLADSLRTDAHLFHEVRAVAGQLLELREWLHMADELKKEEVRLGNQLYAQLARYYPQMVSLGAKRVDSWLLELWTLLPTPASVKGARKTSIEKLLRRHRVRRVNADDVLRILGATPVTVAAGVTAAATAHIQILVERLELVTRQVRQAHKQLDHRLKHIGESAEGDEGQKIEQRDVEVLSSCTGVGRTVLASLLCEATEAIAARDYQRLRSRSGTAPVTKRSGKSLMVVRRQACNPRLREALYHWARVAVQRDALSHAKYGALRQRGCSHARALRGVADRLLGVACAMLRNGECFDPKRQKAA